MTQDELIQMAGAACAPHQILNTDLVFLERFAALVAAHERETCAKVCEAKQRYNAMHANTEFAAAIRAINFEGDTGFRPVSEMIAEHKKNPKKKAAIERAEARKAEVAPDGRVAKTVFTLEDISAASDAGYKAAMVDVQAEQEPVAWHHPQCDGQCIACLIEKAVQDAYGTQGRDYMLRHINAAAPVRTKDLTDDEIREMFNG